jgi:hypothetical protein
MYTISTTIARHKPKSKNTAHVKSYTKIDFPSGPACTLGALKKNPVVILIMLKTRIAGIHNLKGPFLFILAYSHINIKKVKGSKLRPNIDTSYQNLTEGHSCILIKKEPAVHNINAPRTNKKENTILFFLAAKKIMNKKI